MPQLNVQFKNFILHSFFSAQNLTFLSSMSYCNNNVTCLLTDEGIYKLHTTDVDKQGCHNTADGL